MCVCLYVCVGVALGWACGPSARRPCCISGCSLFSPVSMVTGAAALFGPWLGCTGRPARPSARPSACPAVGAASSVPSRCPQALPGWAQESVFTNIVHTAPGTVALPRRCQALGTRSWASSQAVCCSPGWGCPPWPATASWGSQSSRQGWRPCG